MSADLLTQVGMPVPARPESGPKAGRRRICVIGAGLTGLSAAYRLLQQGHDVTILESTLQPGGLVASFQLGADRIEYIHHRLLPDDRHLQELCEELGLKPMFNWQPVRLALYSGSNLVPFFQPAHLLWLRQIPPRQRLRIFRVLRQINRPGCLQNLDQRTAADWLRQECGDQAYELLWQPILRCRFDQDTEQVSAVWAWHSLRRYSRACLSWPRRPRQGYLDGGFATLITALVRRIGELGGIILYGHTVMEIKQGLLAGNGKHYRISCVLEDCKSVEIAAEAVIATMSSRQFASISSGLDWPDSFLQQARGVRYVGGLCMILRMRRRLSPYYWTTVCDKLPFAAVIEHSHLNPSGRYGGSVVYLTRYLDVTDPLWMQSDGAIYQQFAQGLCRMYPAFNPRDILDWRLRRMRYAQPVIGQDYPARMPAMDTPEPGIKLAGMAQIYPEDRGMNNAVRLGGESARAIMRYLASPACPC